MRLIWKLLRKHVSLFELSIFFIANLIGMVVILAGVQVYTDLRPLVTGENALVGNDYVVISKPVKRVNSKAVFSSSISSALNTALLFTRFTGFDITT